MTIDSFMWPGVVWATVSDQSVPVAARRRSEGCVVLASALSLWWSGQGLISGDGSGVTLECGFNETAMGLPNTQHVVRSWPYIAVHCHSQGSGLPL